MKLKFEGAALYQKREIQKSIDNFEFQRKEYKEYYKNVLLDVEANYKPNRMMSFIYGVSLKGRYKESSFKFGYGRFLLENKFLNHIKKSILLDIEKVGVEEFNGLLSVKNDFYIYKEIKGLFGDGRQCYLNPKQAEFVNTWKNKKIEKEVLFKNEEIMDEKCLVKNE